MDFNIDKNYYITHVVVMHPPEEGFNQLFYYATRDKTLKDGKFYWGRGNNFFGQIFIDNLMKANKILKIDTEEYPLLLKEDETLWFDKTGTVFKASHISPLINQKKICTLEGLAKK